MHKKLLVFFALLWIIPAMPQTEKSYWGKAEVSYIKKDNYSARDYSFKSESLSGAAAEAFTKTYWLFISDLDGDNCPFRPSCSEFLQESVKQTNLLAGTLMFFDRFTRDMNFVTRHRHYDITPEGYLVDPPENYIF